MFHAKFHRNWPKMSYGQKTYVHKMIMHARLILHFSIFLHKIFNEIRRFLLIDRLSENQGTMPIFVEIDLLCRLWPKMGVSARMHT